MSERVALQNVCVLSSLVHHLDVFRFTGRKHAGFFLSSTIISPQRVRVFPRACVCVFCASVHVSSSIDDNTLTRGSPTVLRTDKEMTDHV